MGSQVGLFKLHTSPYNFKAKQISICAINLNAFKIVKAIHIF
jgi:hypothetical protein